MQTTEETPKEILSEGKTKIIYQGIPGFVVLRAKDDITAGDGAKHDIIPGKAELATATTCNVFRLLKECGIPVAFEGQQDERSFIAHQCEMIKFEVVVRRAAYGSYLKRNPHVAKGTIFPKLIVEFYLKTEGKKWGTHDLPKDDPLAIFAVGDKEGLDFLELYRPDMPIHTQQSFLTINLSEVIGCKEELQTMADIAKESFLILEKAWELLGRKLVDYKVEFGRHVFLDTKESALLLADVIDNDSWRVIENGTHIDKQAYREGADLSEVAEKYRHTKELTDRFCLPQQGIILWNGSRNDDTTPFRDAFLSLIGTDCSHSFNVGSFHKNPVQCLLKLDEMIGESPDSVLIINVGMSNGAGPIAAAHLSIPVISVPANAKERPEDVWSSLRMPSDVPNMTVLSPHNAVLAALQILAMRNPQLYAKLRMRQEERLCNTVLA